MTDLYDRLFVQDDSIAVHYFSAAIVDYMTGNTTRNQIIGAWALDAEATTDLDVLLDALNALTGLAEKLRFVAEMDAVNLLAESKLKYTTKASYATRLGL